MKTSKETIIEVLLKLLHEKSFEELKVKEIVQKAKISRSTFYLHFADKYELMEEVRRELNDRFFYRFTNKDSSSGKSQSLYIYVSILLNIALFMKWSLKIQMLCVSYPTN